LIVHVGGRAYSNVEIFPPWFW